MIKSIPCPICLSESFESLIDFGSVPQTGTYLLDYEQKPQMTNLSFEFCTRCALIRRKSLNDEMHSYTYIDRITQHQMPNYVDLIIESLNQNEIDSDELIIECGSNDGAFLTILKQAGFSNLIGIEPSLYCANKSRSKGHNVIIKHLDYAESQMICKEYGQASVIICRHVLEHVQNPFDFLLAIQTLLKKDGILFIEVPNAHGITKKLFGHELWDEHLHSFTPENLSLLIQRAGFKVERTLLKSHQKSSHASNILQWCRPKITDNYQNPILVPLYPDVELCRSFADRWKLLCKQILNDLPNWQRPIICIGASHPQTNFLIFTGLGHQIDFLIDDDKTKIGRYLPVPKPVLIISSIQFINDNMYGTVVRTAFGYDDWMDRLVEPLIDAGIRIISPYD